MANKKNEFLAKLEAKYQAKCDAACLMTQQFMLDTLQMTIHQEEGWGYEKIYNLCDKWLKTCQEYKPCLDSRNKDADYYQEHMDRVLKQIIGSKRILIPYKDRYKNQMEIKY